MPDETAELFVAALVGLGQRLHRRRFAGVLKSLRNAAVAQGVTMAQEHSAAVLDTLQEYRRLPIEARVCARVLGSLVDGLVDTNRPASVFAALRLIASDRYRDALLGRLGTTAGPVGVATPPGDDDGDGPRAA